MSTDITYSSAYIDTAQTYNSAYMDIENCAKTLKNTHAIFHYTCIPFLEKYPDFITILFGLVNNSSILKSMGFLAMFFYTVE